MAVGRVVHGFGIDFRVPAECGPRLIGSLYNHAPVPAVSVGSIRWCYRSTPGSWGNQPDHSQVALVALRTGPAIKGTVGVIVGLGLRFGRAGLDGLTDLRQALAPAAVGQKLVAPDSHQPFW